jgi:propanediol utilization protein
VWLSGRLAYAAVGELGPARLDGRVRVGGAAAAHGSLQAGVRLAGNLDGRPARAPRTR